MDLDPFVPVAITAATMRFLDVFLLHCLLAESPPDTPGEIAAIKRNQQRAAARGREPGLTLERGAHQVALSEWGGQLHRECGPLAEALDAAHVGAAATLENPGSTPSARMLDAMVREHDKSYVRFVLALSRLHAQHLRGLPLPREVEAHFARLAEESAAAQRQIEAADAVPFETFRQRYLSPEQLKV
jgi:glutamate--cysteine ligase